MPIMEANFSNRKNETSFKKGHIPFSKGKHLTKQHRKNLSKSHVGNKACVGRVFTEKMRDTMSKAQIGISSGEKNGFYGKTHTIKTKKLLSKLRSKIKVPRRDTIPEKLMQLALDLQGIQYDTHKSIKLKNSFHQTDIFINPRMCLEVDGCYFHACPDCFRGKKLNEIQLKNLKNDSKVNHELNELGYHVIRVWEHNVKSDSDKIAKNIVNLAKECKCSLIHGRFCNLGVN